MPLYLQEEKVHDWGCSPKNGRSRQYHLQANIASLIFPLSNCVNSGIFDVMVLAQYRPQSLMEHIGSGAPWDLNRDFTGGIRILTPYKARNDSDWYAGTADAVQQNFGFRQKWIA